MKKDYRPKIENLSENESEYTEEYWSQIWEKSKIIDDINVTLEKKDEYKILSPFLDNLKYRGRILDGGCGLGQWTVLLAQKGFDVTGIDISQKTIGKLKEKFLNCNFIVDDLRSTSFRDDYFDIYFSWGSFEHFEIGFGPCFMEARRILKSGGYLFVTVPYQNKRHLRRDNGDLSEWDENFDKINGYESPMRFYQYRLTKPELKREYEINGFKCVNIEAIAKRHGLYRMIINDLCIDPASLMYRIAIRLLYPLIRKDYISHMILGVGQKK